MLTLPPLAWLHISHNSMSSSPQSVSPWLQTVPPKRQFPMLTGEVSIDVVVVGAGIVGVMASYYLAKAGKSVVLLEKNLIGTGDTALTTGFLTRVPDTSFAMLAETYGPEFVQKLLTATRATQQDLFAIIEKERIDCDFRRCESYYGAYREDDETLKTEWSAISASGTDATFVKKTDTPDATGPWTEAVQYPDEGQFHSRKFLFGILESLKNHTTVYEESEVIDIVADTGVTVRTSTGTVRAKQLVVTTGLPIPALAELQPLVDQKLTFVIAAKYEKAPLPRNLYWDTLDPYYYYRMIDDHTLIIGGRDRRPGERSDKTPHQELEQFLRDHIPGNFTVTNAWSGSIFHTKDGLPYAFAHPQYPKTIFVGTGFGGNGLVMGTMAARMLAEQVANQLQMDHTLLSLARTGVTIAKAALKKAVGPTKKQFVRVAAVADLNPGKPLCVTAGYERLALFQVKGKMHAITNTCTHAGGSLCDGIQEDGVIECPLHAARFEIATGAVVGGPAVRGIRTFPTRVVGDQVEIEVDMEATKPPKLPPRKKHWKAFSLFSGGALIFWLTQFFYQYQLLVPGDIKVSLIRSFALAGMTLISAALFSSAIFKWIPKTAIHWRLRRYLGVSGVVFIGFHILTVIAYYFNWQIQNLFVPLNPLLNPMIFGILAFPIFFAMAVTSTDWAVAKLGGRRWKRLHQLVYFAYAGAVAHFIFIGFSLLTNVAGYLLLTLITLTLFGELYWYIRTVMKKKKITLGTIVGVIIIASYLILGYLFYQKISALLSVI